MLKWLPALLAGLFAAVSAHGVDSPAGLALTVTAGGESDRSVAENVWLFVPAGQPATPFVPAGSHTARWEGFIASDLRADYAFHVEHNGQIKVTIGGAVALEGTGAGNTPISSKLVRLNKGPNPITVDFTSPPSGDSFVRLFWSNPETPYNPVPAAAFTHTETPQLAASLQARAGRGLFAEYRCAKCHSTPGGMAELAMDAPTLDGIGARRNFDWLARWVEDPAKLRPGTPMPAMFHGAVARRQAEAVAAFLASLKGGAKPDAKTGDVPTGKALYEKLHCAACHNAPDTAEADPKKISQKQVKAKFAPGTLAQFLLKPEEHFAWIRMPNFKLSPDEAGHLAAYLEAAADAPTDRPAPTEPSILEQGRELVRSVGCLNCHHLEGSKTSLAAKTLDALPIDRWSAGCVADPGAAADGSKAPRFAFADRDRLALRAFARTDRKSLTRHTDADFLERQSQALNCRECHGKFEGFPTWDLLGGKLKPEWAGPFIAGAETHRPRPWLEPRMPGFPAYGPALATGLATSRGLPPKSPEDAPPDADAAAKGRKLVSANGGFSCVSCHGAGEFAATQVFEAPGINLALSYDRVQRSYFNRWLRSPLSVDPTTKMPGYFDEQGRSPLTEIYDGDGPKTLNAIWEYLRLRDKMPRPE